MTEFGPFLGLRRGRDRANGLKILPVRWGWKSLVTSRYLLTLAYELEFFDSPKKNDWLMLPLRAVFIWPSCTFYIKIMFLNSCMFSFKHVWGTQAKFSKTLTEKWNTKPTAQAQHWLVLRKKRIKNNIHLQKSFLT